MHRLLGWIVNVLVATLSVLATIVLIYALQARRLPDLQPWHTQAPAGEMQAAELDAGFTLDRYLGREQDLFEETRTGLLQSIPLEQQLPGNRYWAQSPNYQWLFPRDWNRSFELRPARIEGGALLLHGLTDSPYSMRAIARALFDRGYYVLALRMPGHGTVPAALAQVTWQDWMAATRLGARAVRSQIGADAPLLMVGYSNGAALSVKHQLDALEDASLPRADRIVLMSPMIGISPSAALARLLGRLSFIPYFVKSAWTEVQPEFNPFKFNSFPLNGAVQTRALTEEISRGIGRLEGNGGLARMPPILAFQSLLDSTVSTRAVVRTLFAHLPANGSELVLFDFNRNAVFATAFKRSDREFLRTLFDDDPRAYRLQVITNNSEHGSATVRKSIAARSREIVEHGMDVGYPRSVYSLSHIALPFPVSDPVYGLEPDYTESFGVRLGTLVLHGEHNALAVPLEQLTRLGSNPFYPYLEQRVLQWASATGATP
ncbi:MAG: alpha/beta fold hydrolase [Gammaproteobacteria bacterium]|nr:alpha/beta fold hydrolase [Gammaproteobacteria bacterium]